jgi:hypothetical protein
MTNNESPAAQNPFAPSQPDWGHWKVFKSIRLWHAVALACNLDPYQFTAFGNPQLDRQFARRPQEFDDLLSLAKSSIGGVGILKPVSISTEGLEESEIAPSIFGAWAKSIRYTLPPEFPWQDEAVLPLSRDWPWGTYETELLRKLALAANRFWRHYDPSDPTTAPTNESVVNWLKTQGVPLTGWRA